MEALVVPAAAGQRAVLAGQIAAVAFAAWTALRLGRGAVYDPMLFRALDEAEALPEGRSDVPRHG